MTGRCLAPALPAVMVLSVVGYGDKGGNQLSGQTELGRTGLGQIQAATFDSGKIVNIGVTSPLNTLNPLLMDGIEMNKCAADLVFLLLVELDQNMEFEGMLADSMAAEDKRNFLVHTDDEAIWSGGTPATADDVVCTALRLYNLVIGSPATMYYVFEGVGDNGFVGEGVGHVEGIVRVDDKTVCFTTEAPMLLTTFNSSYTRYLMPLPKYVIGDVSEKASASNPWLSHPDVVSSPYKVTEFDRDHYVPHEADKDYWKGAPVIERPSIRTAGGNQLCVRLKSGEIGITQDTMSTIPLENYESVAALENVEVSYGAPITNQSILINTDKIADAKVCQAMLYAVSCS